jgi:pimeloyl-ACP methyl ester carboxylesterase
MPADMRGIVAGVSTFLAAEDIDRPHVAGNSLGGAIALELAAAGLAASVTALSPAGFFTRAQRCRSLVVLWTLRATTFLPAPALRFALRSRTLRAMSFAPLLARPSRLRPERAAGDAIAMRRGRGFRPAARATRDYRFTAEPAVPVTIAWGDKDRILPPSQAVRARARLPRAQHVALPGCGHVPMSDDPDLVASTILATTRAAQR